MVAEVPVGGSEASNGNAQDALGSGSRYKLNTAVAISG